MSDKRPIVSSIRVVPKDPEILQRKTGSAGEIYYDATVESLRLFDGTTQGGFDLARSDLDNVPVATLRNSISDANISTVRYTVTISGPVSPDTGNKYRIDGVYKPELTFVVGYRYIFDQTDLTNVYYPNANGTTVNRHPLNFSSDNLSGVLGGGTAYTTNVVYKLSGEVVTYAVYNSAAYDTATSRTVEITVTSTTPSTLYYWCYQHLAMGNSISASDPGTGSGTGDRLINGGYHVVLENNGTVSLPEGGKLGNVQGQEVGWNFDGIDLYAPNTLDYVQLNYNNDFFAYIERKGATNFGYFVADLGAGNDWVFDGETGTTSFPAFTFPGTDGTVNQVLTTNGSGTLAWTSLPNIFSTIAVAGQSNVVADTTSDTLTLAAGTGMTITTNSGTDTITLASTVQSFNSIEVAGQDTIEAAGINQPLTIVGTGGINLITDGNTNTLTIEATTNVTASFTSIAVAGQSNVVADGEADTLTLVAGPNITITTTPGTDSITISASTGGGGPSGVSSGTAAQLAYYASTGAVVEATGANLTWDGSVLRVNGSPVITSATEKTFNFYIAADDSTIVTVRENESVKFIGGTGITTASDAEGNITITATATAPNVFQTIAVSGQTNVVADAASDTLTFSAGTGITITTDATTDTITITNSSPNTTQNVFSTIAVTGQSNVVADSTTDTLTLIAGTNVTITTDATNDSVTINASYQNFSDLTDVSLVGSGLSGDNLTVDKIAYPAIAMLKVTNDGQIYNINSHYTGNNPTIYAISGTTIAFNLNVNGHPFLIQTAAGANYNTGLIHVAFDGTVSQGSSAQGKVYGTLYWQVPFGISGTYRYQCAAHPLMQGNIIIKDISAI